MITEEIPISDRIEKNARNRSTCNNKKPQGGLSK